jgi:hypothetical protein
MKEFNFILLGWALATTASTFFMGWLLFKKPTNTYEIDNLKQKNKRNKQSNIDNDISARITPDNKDIPSNKRKRGLLKRIKEKRLTKKKNK